MTMTLALIKKGEDIPSVTITEEAGETLTQGDDIEAAELFLALTGRDVNHFVSVEGGNWFII